MPECVIPRWFKKYDKSKSYSYHDDKDYIVVYEMSYKK